jgi:hypothetical protein
VNLHSFVLVRENRSQDAVAISGTMQMRWLVQYIEWSFVFISAQYSFSNDCSLAKTYLTSGLISKSSNEITFQATFLMTVLPIVWNHPS